MAQRTLHTCPNCRHQFSDSEATPADPVDQLRAWCLERGHWVGPGDLVAEAVAAEILKRSVNTLRGWRAEARPIPFTKSGAGIRYRLADLVAFENG